MSQHSIRKWHPEDTNFIYATWLRGLYFGNPYFQKMESQLFYFLYQHVLEKMLIRPQIDVRIACLKDDPEVLLGYAVIENDILHWSFVKASWRNMGIAKSLVPNNIKICSHLTKVGKSLMNKYGLRYIPLWDKELYESKMRVHERASDNPWRS